jgi:hypothetical protein
VDIPRRSIWVARDAPQRLRFQRVARDAVARLNCSRVGTGSSLKSTLVSECPHQRRENPKSTIFHRDPAHAPREEAVLRTDARAPGGASNSQDLGGWTEILGGLGVAWICACARHLDLPRLRDVPGNAGFDSRSDVINFARIQ